MENILLSILASLVGAMIFVVKSLLTKSDRLAEARDEHLQNLIGMLRESVNSFKAFEFEEHSTHSKIIETQRDILRTLERLADKIDGYHR